MLKTLIEKEMRDLIGSTKFVFTFGVCALLILLAFYVGAQNHKVNQTHYEASKAENLRQMEGLTDWFSVEQHRIFLPPQPLATLVSGVSNDIGRTIEVNGRGEMAAHDSRFNEEPMFAVFRFLDLEFVFTVVLSLFAILLGYDAVSGEKERGTLRLALANPVPRSTYIVGKLLGSFIALAVALSLAIAAGCLLLPLLGISMSGADWGRLGLVILSGLLYFGAFLSISVFVSAATSRSSSSFLVLLVVWILSVLIVPRAAVLLAGRAIDVPSVDQVASEKGTYARELWKSFRSDMAGFDTQGEEDTEQIMTSLNRYMDSLTNIRDGELDKLAGRLNEERYNKQQEQQALAFSLARVSPAASLTLAVSRLAATSLDLKSRFKQAAMDYQRTYGAFMKEKTGMNVGGRLMIYTTGDDEDAEPIDPTEMPDFEFRQPALAESIRQALPDMGLLALFNLIFVAAACWAFLRYDVR